MKRAIPQDYDDFCRLGYHRDFFSEADVWDAAARQVWGYNPKTEQLGAIEAAARETGAFVAGVQCNTEWTGISGNGGGQGIHPDVLNHVRERMKRDAWGIYQAGNECPFEVEQTARERAEGWLIARLALGADKASEIIDAAREAGIGKRTLDYAKRAIGIECKRQSDGNRGRGCWWWNLPAEERERVAA